MIRRTMFGVLALSLAGAVAGRAAIHQTTYKGTVTTIEKARFEADVTNDQNAATGKVWFAAVEKTKILRGDTLVPRADAGIAVGERIVVIVAHGDEAGVEWTCTMHPEVAEPQAGRCPKCGMTLVGRATPAKATEIRLPARARR